MTIEPREGESLLSRGGPGVAVVLATLSIGMWSVRAVFPDPMNLLPDTPFSNGALLAASLGRAEFAQSGYIANHTDLLAWPMGAAYNPVMWPTIALALVVSPVLSVSLAMALTPLANALGGMALGRQLRLSPTAQATAGALLAFSPWVRETLANGQFEQSWPGAVACVWAVGVRARERPTATRFLGLALLSAVCGASFPHLALGGAIGLGVWFAWDWLAAGPRSPVSDAGWIPDRRIAAFVALSAVAAGTLLAAAWHQAGYDSAVNVFAPKGSGKMPSGLDGLPEVTSFRSLLLPPPPPTTPSAVLHCSWLGWTLPAVASFAGLRDRRSRRFTGIAIASLVLLVLSLGPQMGPVPLPYRLLTLLSPTVEASGSAYRMVGAALVPLCILAATGQRNKWMATFIVLAAWTETVAFGTRPLPYHVSAVERDPTSAALNAHAGPVLDLPLGNRLCPAGHYALEATRRGRPVTLITSGLPYSARPGFLHRVTDVQSSPDCAERMRALLSAEGFTSVVLHDHGCGITRSLRSCLVTALGPGETVPLSGRAPSDTITWWSW